MSNTKISIADEFFKHDENNFQTIPVSGIPGFPKDFTVHLRSLSQEQRGEISDLLISNAETDEKTGTRRVKSMKGYTQAVVAYAVVDPKTNKPVFTVEQVGRMSHVSFEFLKKKANEVSGHTEEAVDDAKGNSESDQ